MGNNNSITKNICLNHVKYQTNVDLYIHSTKDNEYYISTNEYINMGSDSSSVNLWCYLLPQKSIVNITKFEFKNNEIRLMAKLTPASTDKIVNLWSLEKKEVNVISMFNIIHNSHLKPI